MVLSNASQRQVWQKVQEVLSHWEVSSQTKALGAMYEFLKGEFQRRVLGFKFAADQAGMIVTVDGTVLGLEYFGDRMMFSRDAKGILANSYVPEARTDTSGHMVKNQIDDAIEEFVQDLRHRRKHADIVHHSNRLVYACAV